MTQTAYDDHHPSGTPHVPTADASGTEVGVWETVEVALEAARDYANPYVDCEVWVILRGPDGSTRRVWGFWDGGRTFRVRMTGVLPGQWEWQSHSDPQDAGLAGRSGSFTARAWSEEEKRENPNRRGFIRPTASGRAWEYADGTPFYMLADTWWGAGTWRYPLAGETVPGSDGPSPGNFSFEIGIDWLRRHGFNSIGLISALPNWNDDGPMFLKDDAGVPIRSGKTPHDNTCMTMHSVGGHRAFAFPGRAKGKPDAAPDYDRIVPEYFQDLDRKMFHMGARGMVPYFETVRRDLSLIWYTYHDWRTSFPRYINYLAARYGSLNLIFSLVHFDGPDLTMPHSEWSLAFDHWYERYTGADGLPFGQPTVVMGSYSSYRLFGHITDSPWLTAHSVGNLPKDHSMELHLEEAMKIHPPVPGYCNEPYYVGWVEEPRPEMGGRRNNEVAGEKVEKNSERDNYFARAHAWGHMMNGGLAGHIVGTGSRWCIGPGEPYSPNFPPPGETLHYTFVKEQARRLPEFLLGQGEFYTELRPAGDDLSRRRAPGYGLEKLEGWAHMIRTPGSELALLYFEQQALRQTVGGLRPQADYEACWYDPRSGQSQPMAETPLRSDADGRLQLPAFPEGGDVAVSDWAARLRLSSGAPASVAPT
jgi:hypothetical protein